MNTKHGVTGIIFESAPSKPGSAASDAREGRRFLLLHRVLNWSGWEFVKGGIDEGESPEVAVLREIEEEAGLKNVRIVSRLPLQMSWMAKDTKYLYTPFLVKYLGGETVDLEQKIIEHDAFEWISEEKVEGMLKHIDNKRIFKKAIELLDSHGQ
ncbi:MAG: NUDIX hydrolase [archaeon]|nr:NUDIX hydrolase [archaeon]